MVKRPDQNQTTKTPDEDAENREFIKKCRHYIEAWLRILPWLAVLGAALVTVMVWWPLADIREHTKEISKLSGLPKTLEQTETRLTGNIKDLGDKVSGLEKSVATLTAQSNGAATQATAAAASAANAVTYSDAAAKKSTEIGQQLDGMGKKISAIEEKTSQLSTVTEKLDKSVNLLEKRLAVANPSRAPIVVSLTLAKPTNSTAGETGIRSLHYETPLRSIPVLADKNQTSGVSIERIELNTSLEKSTATVTTEAAIDWQRSVLVVTISTTNENADRVSAELASRNGQAAVALSFLGP
jgi:hypothetical protein